MLIIKLVVRKFKSLAARAFRTILRLLPRNRNLWVFGSRSGEHYDENSKYLFEYVNRFVPEIKTIWLTENTQVYKHMKNEGFNVCRAHSFFGYLYSAMAGAIIISISLNDVNRDSVAGAKVIQLWHGTPMKTTDIFGMGEKYDMVIVSAEEFLHNQLLGDRNKAPFVLTGYPRNDVLLSIQEIESIERLKAKYHFKKMVLYLPTYRDHVHTDGSTHPIKEFDLLKSFDFDIDHLESVMKQHCSLFVLKLHPAQTFNDDFLVEQIHRSDYLYLVDPEDPLQDVHEYLKYVDVLVTDYSSVYFDFLLVNRPIIFTPFDFDNYVLCRPLNFSYDEVTPGPKAKNWKEVCFLLQEILSGKDNWAEMRQSVNRRFNAHQDGCSSERVCKEIKSLLGLKDRHV